MLNKVPVYDSFGLQNSYEKTYGKESSVFGFGRDGFLFSIN